MSGACGEAAEPERVAARVAELPEGEGMVVRYHYLQQVPFDEIAARLGVTKGRVSQIHRHARELLRGSLGGRDALDLSV